MGPARPEDRKSIHLGRDQRGGRKRPGEANFCLLSPPACQAGLVEGEGFAREDLASTYLFISVPFALCLVPEFAAGARKRGEKRSLCVFTNSHSKWGRGAAA